MTWISRKLIDIERAWDILQRPSSSQLQNDAYARSLDPGLANDWRAEYVFSYGPAWNLPSYKPPPPLGCDICDRTSAVVPRDGLLLCSACAFPPEARPWSSRSWWLWPLYILAGRWGRRG